jgi:urate oxidase
MATLSFDTYGKTRVRLMQVLRTGGMHQVAEINVSVLLEGDLADSYIAGDNSHVLPTDTVKNTVYVLARQQAIESIEQFSACLGRHFLGRLEHVHTIQITIEQTAWDRIGQHAAAFVQSTREHRVTRMKVTREGESIVSGIRNLHILKTSNSGFSGYLKDEYTTLPETEDRLLGTVLDTDWTLSPELRAIDFNQLHARVRNVLLECFATQKSLSVQHTLYAMGEAALATFKEMQDIRLTMPNKHCLLVDLSRFGLDNPNQIFVPTEEPSGYIEARLTR